MDLADWGILVAMILGFWGAGLSTYNTIMEQQSQRARVRVAIYRGLVDWYPDHPLIIIEAVNTGAKDVALISVGLRMPDDPRDKDRNMWMSLQYIVVHSPSFPHVLKPDRKVVQCVREVELADRMRSQGFSGEVRVIPFFDDEAGRRWKAEDKDSLTVSTGHSTIS